MRGKGALVLGILAGCIIGLVLAWRGLIPAPAFLHRGAGSAPLVAAPPLASGPTTEPSSVIGVGQPHSRFAILAKQVAPGVVNVHTSKTVVERGLGLGVPFGDLFGQLFGNQFGTPGGPQQQEPAPRRFRIPSLGTGFVISDDGLIITNNHVVDGVDKIEIVFADGSRSKGEVVGADPLTDIALIRATAKRTYTPLSLGDSSAMLPGDWVMAVGNPFGLDHTVTVGIVSATGRDIGQGPYDDYIQTDAAINPGNSGGPLLNLAGQVIGINSAINPQANTIGFAVPINMAKAILPQLEKNGHVVRGWLGVAVQRITPDLADALDLSTQQGALIAQVTPGGPADKAGLERGDVIVRYDDVEIQRMRDLPRAVAKTAPGTEVPVEVIRKGEHVTKKVEIKELTTGEEHAEAPSAQSDQGSTAFGFDISDVPRALAQRLGLSQGEGAMITRVSPGGPADSAGIRQGDVIVEVDRSHVTGGMDAETKLQKAGDKTLLLLRRGDSDFFAALTRQKK